MKTLKELFSALGMDFKMTPCQKKQAMIDAEIPR